VASGPSPVVKEIENQFPTIPVFPPERETDASEGKTLRTGMREIATVSAMRWRRIRDPEPGGQIEPFTTENYDWKDTCK
jgi:hypothetical protein